MRAVYVASVETYAGKSAVCIGLATKGLQDGLTVGYMKPLSRACRLVADEWVDEDALFFQNVFRLSEPMSTLVPIALTPTEEEAVLRGVAPANNLERMQAAFAQVANGRDLVLLEGSADLREGYILSLPAATVADALGANELVVARYDENCVDDILAAQDHLGDTLLGVLINTVPRSRMEHMQQVVRPYLERRGVAVLGILPQEQLLQSMDVRDLVEILDGEVLSGRAALDGLVERLMIGAMGVESALSYFRREPNKAVITGGDRPDIQLAALETSTRCLILTGELRPSPVIVERAERVGVPLILVKEDTMATVEKIQSYFGKTRFHQPKKIQRFVRLLEEHFDFERFYRTLDLRG